MEISDHLKALGFPRPKQVTGRTSVADIFHSKSCGIYVLHFANGEFYVGQSIKVVSRFAQHRHTHTDIEKISFKRVARKNLNSEEQAVIRHLEISGFRLRNINLVTFSYGNTDFDMIMPHSEQERWLDDLSFIDSEGERFVDDRLRGVYRRKYQELLTLPHVEDVIRVVREYVRQCIPAVKRGEAQFWACSCLPKKDTSIYIRINVGWQVAFDAFNHQGKVRFRWFLREGDSRKIPPVSQFGLQYIYRLAASTIKLAPKPLATAYYSGLTKGGKDQVYVEADGIERALLLLNDRNMVRAARRFNLSLVQKSPCPWGKNHCLDLADRLIE